MAFCVNSGYLACNNIGLHWLYKVSYLRLVWLGFDSLLCLLLVLSAHLLSLPWGQRPAAAHVPHRGGRPEEDQYGPSLHCGLPRRQWSRPNPLGHHQNLSVSPATVLPSQWFSDLPVMQPFSSPLKSFFMYQTFCMIYQLRNPLKSNLFNVLCPSVIQATLKLMAVRSFNSSSKCAWKCITLRNTPLTGFVCFHLQV